MTVEAEICTDCKQPKPGAKGGSLTQWIFVCNCAALKSAAVTTSDEGYRFQMCRTCRKRVGSGRDGSLTQFVFRSDMCRCEEPDVQDVAIARISETVHKVVDFDATINQELGTDEIPLGAGSFPTNRFKPIQELGRGASGAVYLCIDRFLGTRVAVKTLHYLGSEQLLSFQQEARAISRLAHPNIVRILDFGATDSGIPYMVLEFIDGVNLENLIAHRRLRLSEIVAIVCAICRALSYAHSKDVFHRDLKPSNILVTEENGFSAKLVDFGVARMRYETEPTTIFEGTAIVGTPAYMSPDQMRGKTYDQRSEIYSVGCILFELFTGSQVYESDTVMEVLSKHVHARIPLVTKVAPTDGFPAAVDDVIARCLAKDPNHRYQSPEELIGALEALTPMTSRIASDDSQTDDSEQSSLSGSDPLSDAFYRAYREPGFANQEEADSTRKNDSKTLLMAAVAFFVIGVTVLCFYFAKSPLYQATHSAPGTGSSADKPGELENALLETKYQLNMFNGSYWYFNLAPVTADSFDELLRSKKSKRVWLDSGEVSPDGWLKLKPMKLDALAIINIQIGKEDFERLLLLNTLKALRLFEIATMDDDCLAEVSKMNGLEELFLRLDHITDKGIMQLSSLKNLKYLSLDRCLKVTDRCLDTLESMKTLERLSLAKTAISEAGVRRVSKWKNLKVLSLSYCDSGIVSNLIANKIEKLSLRGTQLSKEDFFRLAILESLKQLDVRDAKAITGKDVKRWRAIRASNHLPPCRLINERHTQLNYIGEMVSNTYDDEHLWTDE